MNQTDYQSCITAGQAILGIELGSTRIKAVLIAPDHTPLAHGDFEWENLLENGIWTYHLEDVWTGLQNCWKKISLDVQEKYHVPLQKLGAMGISGMMHGYLVFDRDQNQLVPFRTWRNTMTEQAARELTERFGFNIPQRWSIAHLYQAILNGEEHVSKIARMTTLAGYVHWKLTGENMLGVGEASGMFPIDSECCDYHPAMLEQFDALLAERHLPFSLRDILPTVCAAGQICGTLTPDGAALLDPSGTLQPGTPLCPVEGDVGTGMVATNSVAPRTGNISAGTSIFSMIVLEKPLQHVYPEIDLVTTPTGFPTAMVHCNNCTSDLNAWIQIFHQALQAFDCPVDLQTVYGTLYNQALSGQADCGGLLAYNYFSGEPVTQLDSGRPLFMRQPDSAFSLPNFIRTLLFSSMATLKIGMDLLFQKEQVQVDCLSAHVGLFKTPVVGQRLLAAAMNAPVSIMRTAGDGGAWGIAILAAYYLQKAPDETLEAYLAHHVFQDSPVTTVMPEDSDVQGFSAFMQSYQKGLACERIATQVF